VQRRIFISDAGPWVETHGYDHSVALRRRAGKFQGSCEDHLIPLNNVIHGGHVTAENQLPPHEAVLVPLGGSGVVNGVVGGGDAF
jgi:hypothetical protein